MTKTIALISSALVAIGTQAHAQEALQGFTLHGEAINPVCISKMRPWVSDQGIIVKSIVLENCQKSNWAFHKKPVEIKGNVVTTDIDGKPFAYKVIGKTTTGLFIVHHTDNEIAAYSMDEETIRPDLLKPETQKVHILTNVSNAFVPCFKEAEVKKDTIVMKKQISDLQAPHAQQCKEEIETVEYTITP